MSKVGWKDQFKDIQNSSKFHNTVRDIFRTDPFFSSLKCFQEVPVHELIIEYEFHQHRYDWYIQELNTVVELHGQQHYQMTNFGNIGYDRAEEAFQQSQQRDTEKKYAAIDNGFKYIEIPYKVLPKLNATTLKQFIFTET